MRRPRVKAPETHSAGYYHCVSRVVGREFLFGDEEKDQFVRYMRLYEKLYGLRVVSQSFAGVSRASLGSVLAW